MTETLAVLVLEDREVVPVAVTVKTVATAACPRTVLGQNFPDQETGRGNAKTESVVSERREIYDAFVLRVQNGAALGPGSATTTTGLSRETELGSKAASKMITTTINKGTTRKDRDKRLLLPGII